MTFIPNTVLTAEALNDAFAEKAGAWVEASLEYKADKWVESAVEEKADKWVESAVEEKADASSVSLALSAKADLVDGKVPVSQLPDAILGALSYQGTWNAETNSPELPAADAGNKGHYYVVSAAGGTEVDGESDWQIGDWIVSGGTSWGKVDNSDKVSSVNGKAGAVTLGVADIGGAAPLESPSFTGAPTAPTAEAGDESTQVATTAFVKGEVGAILGNAAGQALAAGGAAGVAATAARSDHKHPYPTAAQVGALASGGALGTPASGNLTNCTADGENDVGFRCIPQNARSAAYTLTLTDAGKHILHPAADTTARTYTIPANASVPYPIGTAITFVNQAGSGGIVTIAINTDTMRLAGPGATGSRTLARNGIATALKITATEWIISGTGLT